MSSIRGVAINGSAIRNTRKLLGIGATAFAEEIGVPYSTLANIENGHRPSVSPEVFQKLAFALRLADVRAILANPYADYTFVQVPYVAQEVECGS